MLPVNHIQAHKIIVIQPGSLNLRIGCAVDLNPKTVLHAIAYKRRCTDDPKQWPAYRDSLIPGFDKEAATDFEEHRLKVCHIIQAQGSQFEPRTTKRLRAATPSQQIATYNRRSVPEVLPLHEDENDKPNHLVGDKLFAEDILKLSPKEALNYNIHFPIRRGELNLHNGIGGSMAAVLASIEEIWLNAIHAAMNIKPGSLSQYGAVLVIPDIYNRSHLRELVTLLLQRLKFRACFLLQDHVAATFGAGLGFACVVDVGDHKCSVSCVEDGISHTDTRVRLPYGGGDVTQVFHRLLKKCGFPYKDCDLVNDFSDGLLLKRLKERFCHINFSVCGAQEKNFIVKKHLLYTIQMGDECIVAPLALFHTELLNITGKTKPARLQNCLQSDSEDCFDAEYIRETSRRNGRDGQLLEGSLPVTGDMGEEELVAVDTFDVPERDNSTSKSSVKDEQLYMLNGQVDPLDIAIVRSIERCPTDELKRKMYSSILLVGEGVKFEGFPRWLEWRVRLQMSTNPQLRTNEQNQFEVNVYTKEMDSAIIAWKGGAIMSCLESAPELWIFDEEWRKFGLRGLREKAPFMW